MQNFVCLHFQNNAEMFEACISQLTSEQAMALHNALSTTTATTD